MVNTYRAAAWCEWAAKELTLSTVDGGDEPQQSWPQQPDLLGHEEEKSEAEKGTQDIGMLLDEADADSGQSEENWEYSRPRLELKQTMTVIKS
jgi:hypothetical protein